MAISMVGGILVSTLLTLFVVPSAYSLIDDAVEWNRARKKKAAELVARPSTGPTV
jgi:predicted RND superfamily exporter protein